MSDLSHRIGNRLRDWAAWRLALEHHQFYPQSVAARSEPGSQPAKSTIPRIPRRNPEAEHTDKALTKLQGDHTQAYRVITRHYLDGATAADKAAALEMSPRRYQRLLDRASWFIAGAV